VLSRNASVHAPRDRIRRRASRDEFVGGAAQAISLAEDDQHAQTVLSEKNWFGPSRLSSLLGDVGGRVDLRLGEHDCTLPAGIVVTRG
jgi:hypothetical protein